MVNDDNDNADMGTNDNDLLEPGAINEPSVMDATATQRESATCAENPGTGDNVVRFVAGGLQVLEVPSTTECPVCESPWSDSSELIDGFSKPKPNPNLVLFKRRLGKSLKIHQTCMLWWSVLENPHFIETIIIPVSLVASRGKRQQVVHRERTIPILLTMWIRSAVDALAKAPQFWQGLSKCVSNCQTFNHWLHLLFQRVQDSKFDACAALYVISAN